MTWSAWDSLTFRSNFVPDAGAGVSAASSTDVLMTVPFNASTLTNAEESPTPYSPKTQ